MTRKPGIPGPKPSVNPGKKRKQEQDLSNNPHTTRGRELLATKNDEEKAIIRRKNNDRAAFVTARLKLRASHSWKEGSAEDREKMEDLLKSQIMNERYEKGQSAQFFIDELEKGEDVNSPAWDVVDFENDTEFCYHAQLDDIASHETIPTVEASQEAEQAQSSTTGQLVKNLHLITWSHFRLSLLHHLTNLDKKIKILGQLQSCENPLFYNKKPFYLKGICPDKIFLKEERAAWSILRCICPNKWVTLPGPSDWWEGYSHQYFRKFWGFISREEARELYQLGVYITKNNQAPEDAAEIMEKVIEKLEHFP